MIKHGLLLVSNFPLKWYAILTNMYGCPYGSHCRVAVYVYFQSSIECSPLNFDPQIGHLAYPSNVPPQQHNHNQENHVLSKVKYLSM